MARVIIERSLLREIKKRFSRVESHRIVDRMERLEAYPKSGKPLGTVGGIVIKQIKYRSFRFFFITDGDAIRCLDEAKLVGLLLRFVRMAHKKHQHETIEEIKSVLRKVGPEGF